MSNINTNYTHLLLDLDNTLFDFDACERAALDTFFKALCVEVKPEYIEAYHESNRRCWQLVEKGEMSIDDVNPERVGGTMRLIEDMGAKLLLSPNDAGALLVKALSDNDILLDGAYELTKDLSRRYTLIGITNGFESVKKAHMTSSGLGALFERVFISQTIGYSKPDTRFFDAVFEGASLEKADCLVIGDSLSSDMEGALRYGLDACWLNLKQKTPDKKTYQYEVNNYKELRKLLLDE